MSVISIGSKEKELLNFFLKLFLIWISWKAILFILGEEHIKIDQRFFPALSSKWEDANYKMVQFLLGQSQAILHLMGENAFTKGRKLWIDGYPGVGVGNYCIGVQLMYYYAMLVLISTIGFWKKIIGIIIGILITQTLNIIRIVGLCLISAYYPEYVFLFHDFIFNVVVFGTLIVFYYFFTRN